MIKKIRIKFILLSCSLLLILLTVIVAGMNVINYMGTIADADEILNYLLENKGTFPKIEMMPQTHIYKEPSGALPPNMSPELPYESRFFSVILNNENDVVFCDVSKIASVNVQRATEFAREVSERDKEKGFVEEFRYIMSVEENGTRIIFLDCGRKIEAFRFFRFSSISMALVGFVIVSAVLCFFADRIIRPIRESYEKQRRFITDAGHELKTPLTIIEANVDILEMDVGENESLQDIKKQCARLATLTEQLVFLTKMEEKHTKMKTDFELSTVVNEVSNSFKYLARSEGKVLLRDIQDDIWMNGENIATGQLVSIILENAIKYSPEGALIDLTLKKQNKWAVLTVSNPSSYDLTQENLEKVFDRFYKADGSRNSSKGGHGIGLSIARAITELNGGKITVSSKDGKNFKVTAAFPLIK